MACIRIPFLRHSAGSAVSRTTTFSKPLHTPAVRVRTCGTPVSYSNTNINGHWYFRPVSVAAFSIPTPADTAPLELALPRVAPDLNERTTASYTAQEINAYSLKNFEPSHTHCAQRSSWASSKQR